MAKQRFFSAIDVGTSKVCTLIASVQDGAPTILGVGITPSEGIRKGLVVDLDQAKEAIRKSVRLAEHASGLSVKSAYVGVTGQHISASNNRGVVAISRNDRMVSSRDLKRVLQSARSVSIPDERQLLHVVPRTYALDGQAGIKNPVGMAGFRLDVETHVITASTASVQNLVRCVRGVGVEIEELVLEPLASAESVLRPDEKIHGTLLVDIGAGTTDIAIFRDGSIWHTSVLPVGGYQVSRDISIGLGIPYEMAEEIKKRHGTLLIKNTNGHQQEEPEVSEVGEGDSALNHDMCEIIRARIEEVLHMILLEVPGADYLAAVPSGMVLTGGTANLPGIDILAQQELRMPVRIGIPQGMTGLSDDLHDPAYATSIGLLLWGAKQQTDEFPYTNCSPNPGKSGVIRHLFYRAKSMLP